MNDPVVQYCTDGVLVMDTTTCESQFYTESYIIKNSNNPLLVLNRSKRYIEKFMSSLNPEYTAAHEIAGVELCDYRDHIVLIDATPTSVLLMYACSIPDYRHMLVFIMSDTTGQISSTTLRPDKVYAHMARLWGSSEHAPTGDNRFRAAAAKNLRDDSYDSVCAAMRACGWYNGLRDDILMLTEHVIANIRVDTKDQMVVCPDWVNYDKTDHIEASYLWMLSVMMFGDYGTSPRYGWVEKPIQMLDFITRILPDPDDEEE